MTRSGRNARRLEVALAAALVLVITVAGAASAAAPPKLSWSRVAPPAMAGAILRDVTSNSGFLVAVGSTGLLDAGIWRSRDAVHWTRIDLGELGSNVVPQSVTAWRQGFAAVGLRYTFASTGIQRDAVVMTSPDGIRWRRADLPGGHTGFPTAIAVHEGVLVAGGCLGVVRRFGCRFAAEAQAVAWTSTDGERWSRRLLPDGDHAFVNGIASVDGRLVLVGTEVDVDESGFASTPVGVAVWEGRTAATARRIRDDALDSGVGNAVLAYRGTYLAVGSRSACIESWKRDGASWTTVDDPTSLCDQEMVDAVVFHGTVYATGFEFSEEQMPVWQTRDAHHWTTVTDSTMRSDGLMLEANAIIEWHGRLLIAGTAFGAAAPDGQIWLGTPGG